MGVIYSKLEILKHRSILICRRFFKHEGTDGCAALALLVPACSYPFLQLLPEGTIGLYLKKGLSDSRLLVELELSLLELKRRTSKYCMVPAFVRHESLCGS